MSSIFRPEQAYVTPPNSHPDEQKPLDQIQPSATQAPRFTPTTTAVQTPMNASPSSLNNDAVFPSLPLKPKSLKSPLYIPAVLRPTERPYRSSPLTPPRSMQGSTDSLDGGGMEPRPTSQRSMSSFRKRVRHHLPQVSEDSISIPVDDLEPVQGPPTQGHWKPDPDATICDAPVCRRAFNLFERRHHCRHCGHIFCSTHSAYRIPLDQNAEFHPMGLQSRACDFCWGQYALWRDARISRHESSAADASTTSTVEIPASDRRKEGQNPVLATSVPDAFQFSTF